MATAEEKVDYYALDGYTYQQTMETEF